MKLRVTMEIEIGDLTDEQRAELEDDLNFVSREKFGTDEFPSDEEEEGYTPTVPTLAEQDPEDVIDTVREALTSIEDWQETVWEGTDVYARIAKTQYVQIDQVPDNRAYRMLSDAVKEKLEITVRSGGTAPDYRGHDPLLAWKAIEAVEEAHVSLRDLSALSRNVGAALILPGLADDEMIADLGGNWIEDWDRENPVDG